MARLKINQFSCIDSADLELGRMTLLIGPQASGKSVVSKLVYFFYDILIRKLTDASLGQSWSDINKEIVDDFKNWFPMAAWGRKRFSIEFRAGQIEICLTRTMSRGKPSGNVKLKVSDFILQSYEDFQLQLKSTLPKSTKKNSYGSIERVWKIQISARQLIESEMGDDRISGQIFIPAGRSFFTSLGKAVAAFYQGGQLDPVTVRFGSLFTQIRVARPHEVIRSLC